MCLYIIIEACGESMNSKKKIIVSILKCLLLLVLVSVSVFYFFEDEDTDFTFVEIDKAEKIFSEDDEFLDPGGVITKRLSIRNNSTETGKVRMYLDNVIGNGGEEIIFHFYYQDELLGSVPMNLLSIDKPFISPVLINSKDTQEYNITIELLDSAGNEYIDKTIRFDLVIKVHN